MADPLLEVVQREGRREREAILERARAEAEQIVNAAREAAEERLRQSPPSASREAPCPELVEARRRVLQAYGDKVAALRAAAVEVLHTLEPRQQDELLARVVWDVLSDLEPGVYRLGSPPGLWEVVRRRDGALPGRSLRWVEQEDGVHLHTEDGRLEARFTLVSLVEQYFSEASTQVAHLLLGDELV